MKKIYFRVETWGQGQIQTDFCQSSSQGKRLWLSKTELGTNMGTAPAPGKYKQRLYWGFYISNLYCRIEEIKTNLKLRHMRNLKPEQHRNQNQNQNQIWTRFKEGRVVPSLWYCALSQDATRQLTYATLGKVLT